MRTRTGFTSEVTTSHHAWEVSDNGIVEDGRNEERHQCGSASSQIGAVLAGIPRTRAADPSSSESRQLLDFARCSSNGVRPRCWTPGGVRPWNFLE